MNRNIQFVVVSAIAVTLFVLLVYPAIINLDVRTTPVAKKLQLQRALTMALLVFSFLPAAFFRSQLVALFEEPVAFAPLASPLGSVRRC